MYEIHKEILQHLLSKKMVMTIMWISVNKMKTILENNNVKTLIIDVKAFAMCNTKNQSNPGFVIIIRVGKWGGWNETA